MNHEQQALHELDEKEFLRQIMKRPGMYVGGNHLDYIQNFFEGFRTGSCDRAARSSWNANYEMQHWLFCTQGVALQTTSLNGWSLFYRCFGNRDVAIGKFAELLHAEIPPPSYPAALPCSEASVAGEIWTHYSAMRFGEAEGPSDEDVASHLFETLRHILAQQEEAVDTVRVLIHKESLFTQLRFVYHTPSGWHDDAALLAKSENYQRLIRLHAMLAYCPYDAFKQMHATQPSIFCSIHGENVPDWCGLRELHHDIRDEETLWQQYQSWRVSFTASY